MNRRPASGTRGMTDGQWYGGTNQKREDSRPRVVRRRSVYLPGCVRAAFARLRSDYPWHRSAARRSVCASMGAHSTERTRRLAANHRRQEQGDAPDAPFGPCGVRGSQRGESQLHENKSEILAMGAVTSMAGLFVESFFQTDSFLGVSVALGNPAVFQDIVQQGEAQPDHLMWAEQGNTPYHLVECKASRAIGIRVMTSYVVGLDRCGQSSWGRGQDSCWLPIGRDDRNPRTGPPPENDGKSKKNRSKAQSSEREFRIQDRKIFHRNRQRAIRPSSNLPG